MTSIDALEKGPPGKAHVLLMAGAYEAELAPFQRTAPDQESRLARLRLACTVEASRTLSDRLGRIPGLTSEFRVIPGKTHMTVLPEALNEAVTSFLGREG